MSFKNPNHLEYVSYRDYNDYDLLNANLIIDNNVDVYYERMNWYKIKTEYLTINTPKGVILKFTKMDYGDALDLLWDKEVTPQIATEKSYKDFKIMSNDYNYDQNKDNNYPLPSLETLVNNKIRLINHPNYRYYEDEYNLTSIHVSASKKYDSIDDVDWDWWHVIMCVYNSKDGKFVVKGTPKHKFINFRKKGYNK